MNAFEGKGQLNAQGIVDLSPAEVRALPPGTRLVDVREKDEYVGDLGHIAGTELVPLATVESRATAWDREAPVVVLCRSGGRSARAASLLRALGFRNVGNMLGGMLAYRASGY